MILYKKYISVRSLFYQDQLIVDSRYILIILSRVEIYPKRSEGIYLRENQSKFYNIELLYLEINHRKVN
jgi:hypothetical protein